MEFEDTVALLDRMRRKRNRAVYEMVGTISEKEASEATTAHPPPRGLIHAGRHTG